MFAGLQGSWRITFFLACQEVGRSHHFWIAGGRGIAYSPAGGVGEITSERMFTGPQGVWVCFAIRAAQRCKDLKCAQLHGAGKYCMLRSIVQVHIGTGSVQQRGRIFHVGSQWVSVLAKNANL